MKLVLDPVFRFRAAQAAVIAITLGLLGVSIYGTTKIEVSFDVFKLFGEDSPVSHYFKVLRRDFDSGLPGTVFTGRIRYSLADFEAVDRIASAMERLRDEGAHLSEVTFWWTPLKRYLREKRGFNDWRDAFQDTGRRFDISLSLDFIKTL